MFQRKFEGEVRLCLKVMEWVAHVHHPHCRVFKYLSCTWTSPQFIELCVSLVQIMLMQSSYLSIAFTIVCLILNDHRLLACSNKKKIELIKS